MKERRDELGDKRVELFEGHRDGIGEGKALLSCMDARRTHNFQTLSSSPEPSALETRLVSSTTLMMSRYEQATLLPYCLAYV